jgi:hypothetical protein
VVTGDLLAIMRWLASNVTMTRHNAIYLGRANPQKNVVVALLGRIRKILSR